MPTRVGLEVGQFKYKDQFQTDDGDGVVLIGEITEGTVAPRMLLQIGSRSIPVLGVEAYGVGAEDYGVLILGTAVQDLYEGDLTPGNEFCVMQNVPSARSREDTNFTDILSVLFPILGN